MTEDEYKALRQPLLDTLDIIRRSYERDAAPYIKRLIEIEATRPVRFVVPQEIIDALNLPQRDRT